MNTNNCDHSHGYFRTIHKYKNVNHKRSVHKLFPEEVSAQKSAKLKDFELTGRVWETYRVNALYNFSYDQEKFDNYQINLVPYVQKALLENGNIYPVGAKTFSVYIQHFKSTMFKLGDKPGVKISIMANEGGMSCFTGFLLSIGRKVGFMEVDRAKVNAVVLPLLLVNYIDKMFLDCVISFLKDNFLCYISPLKFIPYDLTWMLALWSRPRQKECFRATILEYEVPVKEISSIKYVIDPKSVSETWCEIVKLNSAYEISEEQAFSFHSELKKQFHSMFSIDLSHFQLSHIKTPIATVQGDHSIIIFEPDELFPILRHLTHLSQEMP